MEHSKPRRIDYYERRACTRKPTIVREPIRVIASPAAVREAFTPPASKSRIVDTIRLWMRHFRSPGVTGPSSSVRRCRFHKEEQDYLS